METRDVSTQDELNEALSKMEGCDMENITLKRDDLLSPDLQPLLPGQAALERATNHFRGCMATAYRLWRGQGVEEPEQDVVYKTAFTLWQETKSAYWKEVRQAQVVAQQALEEAETAAQADGEEILQHLRKEGLV